MMDVLQCIANRRSIREYRDQPVPEEALGKVLEAARLAPSASNWQDYRFIVVRDKQTRRALVPVCSNQSFVGEAGVVIAACATKPRRVYASVDVAIAVDHMTLAAASLGLGTCWIGAFSHKRVKQILGTPDGVSIVCLLTLGIPASPGIPTGRKPPETLFTYERWT
jgi:nitroreductase